MLFIALVNELGNANEKAIASVRSMQSRQGKHESIDKGPFVNYSSQLLALSSCSPKLVVLTWRILQKNSKMVQENRIYTATDSFRSVFNLNEIDCFIFKLVIEVTQTRNQKRRDFES